MALTSSSRSTCCTPRSSDSVTASPPTAFSGRRHGELRIVVDEFLDAGEALVVDIDVADHVAGGGAHRIDAAIFLDEAEAGLAKLVDLGLLLRRELALDGDESLALLQLLAQLSRC